MKNKTETFLYHTYARIVIEESPVCTLVVTCSASVPRTTFLVFLKKNIFNIMKIPYLNLEYTAYLDLLVNIYSTLSLYSKFNSVNNL